MFKRLESQKLSGKSAFIGVMLMLVVGMALIPQPVNSMIAFSNSGSVFSTDEIWKIAFTFTYPDGSAVVSTITSDEFDSGISVPVNTYLISMVIYGNVSASYYSATPTANTWYNLTITAPTSIVSYSAQYKCDSAYAYNSTDDSLLGSGYNANADYYMVARQFTVQKTLTEGIWIIDITLYLL